MSKNKKQNKKKQSDNKGGNSKKFEGELSTNRRGTGYVRVEGFEEDIEIPREYLSTALPGDIVLISLLPHRKGERQKGEVMKIVEEGRRIFVGKIEKKKFGCFVIADAREMYTDIFIRHENAGKAKNGEKVAAKVISWKNPRENPEGKIVEVLGKAGEHDVEMRSIIIGHGIDTDFPKPVLAEAEEVGKKGHQTLNNPEKALESRIDFRGKITFTIDPVDAKDFDDALSVEKLPNGNTEVGVHIADVSHYVREGTALDKEARERAFSVYLVDRTILMLPEILSNDLCSLKPDVDRFAFSAIFELNEKCEVVSERFGKSIIHSDKRFSYEEANESLKNKGEFSEELQSLNKLSEYLRKEKKRAGALEFSDQEVKFELNKDGSIEGIYKKERLPTHHLVEEFMLLANKRAAKFISKKSEDKKRPFIYRVHEKPDPEKIESLGIFLRALGYEVQKNGNEVSSKDIQKLLESLEGSDVQKLVETSIIRSMSKAIYSVSNIGHFGLGFSHYTHFTSPIRRYPDLIVHRILESVIKGQKVSNDAYKKYSKISREASEKELGVVRAERDSIKFKQAEYMTDHIGEVFDARIVGVTEYGLFVQTLDELIEGLVPIRTMKGFFELDEKNYKLEESGGKESFRLGDKVKVKVTDAKSEEREVDFELVEK